MICILLALLAIVILDLAALRWGADSREGFGTSPRLDRQACHRQI